MKLPNREKAYIPVEKLEVESVITSPHGTKYIIDGLLQGTIGIQARIRTVWIIDIGEERPRFVTAYPA
jgi:hypothetical protein